MSLSHLKLLIKYKRELMVPPSQSHLATITRTNLLSLYQTTKKSEGQLRTWSKMENHWKKCEHTCKPSHGICTLKTVVAVALAALKSPLKMLCPETHPEQSGMKASAEMCPHLNMETYHYGRKDSQCIEAGRKLKVIPRASNPSSRGPNKNLLGFSWPVGQNLGLIHTPASTHRASVKNFAGEIVKSHLSSCFISIISIFMQEEQW